MKVAPSILSADFANLGRDVALICNNGADFVHVDVMDGHFVPNLTIGPVVVKAIKPYATKPLDVHLMMTNPENFIESFIKAGADRITVHAELGPAVHEMLATIRRLGGKAGVSLKPKSDAGVLLPYLDEMDLVLVMSVEPGFGGQFFMQEQLAKIEQIATMRDGRAIEIVVDGGINDKTGALCAKAGADTLIAGSFIFNATDRAKAIKQLKDLT